MRRFVAVTVGLFMPGAGQLILGHFRRALSIWIVAGLFPPVAFGFLVVTGLRAAVIALGVGIALHIGSVIDVLRIAPATLLPGWRGVVGLGFLPFVVSVLLSIWVGGRTVTFRIRGESMCPTLLVDDRLLVTPFELPARRGEVVLFKVPGEGADHVERIVALAGDDVRIADDGTVFVNSEQIPRMRTPCLCHGECAGWIETLGGRSYTTALRDRPHLRPYAGTIPAGAVFVLGDNRDSSRDSRSFGPVPTENIKWRPLYLYGSAREKRVGLVVE